MKFLSHRIFQKTHRSPNSQANIGRFTGFCKFSQALDRANFYKALLPLILVTSLLMTACGGGEDKLQDKAMITAFGGGVIAPEPNSSEIGYQILQRGGNATDAMVSMIYSLAVTMPVDAGLGAGGACLVNDSLHGITESFVFLPNLPSHNQKNFQIPMLSRGMSALHARYGNLAWGITVAPAERLAREGFVPSRTLTERLLQAPPSASLLQSWPELAMLTKASQTDIQWKQPQLALTLMQIKGSGGVSLYQGTSGNEFIASAHEIGASFDKDQVIKSIPQWIPPISMNLGDYSLLFNRLPEDYTENLQDNAQSKALMQSLVAFLSAQNYAKTDKSPEERLKLLQSWPTVASGSSSTGKSLSLLAVDKAGLGIACQIGFSKAWGGNGYLKNYGFVLAEASRSESQAKANEWLSITIEKSVGLKMLGMANGISLHQIVTIYPLLEVGLRNQLVDIAFSQWDSFIQTNDEQPMLIWCPDGLPESKPAKRFCAAGLSQHRAGLPLLLTSND